ncbi:TolC family protein [Parabacteroides sp. OttesenSCG-928-G07]|nr:TolC family protein [Parabacteroides sp. OttesenSCG-928-G21]MDL2277998.1 TolC family protein [Parabacteroides sp. OttesenSCG-928-G07]
MKKFVIILSGVMFSLSCWAQNNIATDTDQTVRVSSVNDGSIQALLDDYESVQLPPLSVFLESVYEHPSVQIYEASRDEEQANLKAEQAIWLNYFRVNASYQFGRIMSLSSTSSVDDPLFYTSVGSNQHTYYVGATISVPIGDLLGQKQRVRAQKARLRRIEYEYEMSIEERKLTILEAYNDVISLLAVLKAKSDAAALYNAQMRISEQDFINGKISIIELSLERSRRSGAVVEYQEGRADLHNAITLLEMLTNVKIKNR